MANPILQQTLSRAPSSPQAAPQPLNNPMAMIQEFQNFRAQMTGKDPKAVLDQLVQSGQISQPQLQQLEQQAQGILSILHR